jgi:hypothetical protein
LVSLKAGVYNVTITDQNNCVTTNSITLTQPDNCNCETSIPTPTITCANCQEVIDNKQNVQILAGKVYCIKISSNKDVNMKGGTLVICGNAVMQTLALNQGDKVVVIGSLTVQNLNINHKSTKFENFGTVTISGQANLGGPVFNYNVMSITQGLNVNPFGNVQNSGSLTIKSSCNVNGTLVNNNYIRVDGDINLNSNGSFTNNCTFVSGKIQVNAQNNCINNGTVTSSKEMVLNSAKLQLGPGSITSVADFSSNQAQITNSSGYCSLLKVAKYSRLNGGSMNGLVYFCDVNGVEVNNRMTLSGGAVFSCSGCATNPTSLKTAEEEVSILITTETFDEVVKLAVYPVPVAFGDEITVSLSKNISRLQVYNVIGSLVMELTGTGSLLTLPSSKLGTGIYMLQVFDEDGKSYKGKVMVE